MSERAEAWGKHMEKWRGCKICTIGRHAKFHVFGKGSLKPQVLFIGEGPGKTEDVMGKPFVGLAGRLLDVAIKRAGGGFGEDGEPYPVRCFFLNLIACRPCDGLGKPNRAPTADEIVACEDRLLEAIGILKPPVVALLGKIPQKVGLARHEELFANVPFYHLPHPAYFLRSGGLKSLGFPLYVEKMKEVINVAKIQP